MESNVKRKCSTDDPTVAQEFRTDSAMKQKKLKVDFDTSLSAINPMEASVGIEAAANPVNTTEQAAMARFWSAMSREVDKKAKDDAALEVDLFAKADTHKRIVKTKPLWMLKLSLTTNATKLKQKLQVSHDAVVAKRIMCTGSLQN